MPQKLKSIGTILILFVLLQGCTLPGMAPKEVLPTLEPTTPAPVATEIQHLTIPISAPDAQPYPDVVSVDTAPEKRAPYGDSYDLNRLERPFDQNMIYNPDLDIASFSISEDADWYYVSVAMVGTNPNNPANIQFSVELDINLDSYGDFLIVAQPPYSNTWTAENITIYADTNRDSAGANPSKSDAPFSSTGFDELRFSPAEGIGGDIDIAWIRINAGPQATVQFAFKKSFSGTSFFYSVMADAGLKDINRLDYVDAFTEQEAGSPIRSSNHYPLQGLHSVDNTCYQALGFTPTGYEPKVCPVIVQPMQVQGPSITPGVDACTASGHPNPGNCSYGWWDYPWCMCVIG